MLQLLLAAALTIPNGDWPAYGRDPGGSKFSPLSQIDKKNVTKLKAAWTFHTGDMYDAGQHPGRGGRSSALETTPLFVDGTLFLTTPFGRVIALDPETGKQKWAYDPKADVQAGYGDFANRGLATWVDPVSKKRLLYIATIDARLIAIDAVTGEAAEGFTQVNLKEGLRNKPRFSGEYEETSPPAVLGNHVIVGSAIADNSRVDAASGEVRAFDARTGKLAWTFDPLLDKGKKSTGAANAWSILSVDGVRNLVFVPVGSASPDYYGGERPGANLYANSVVALNGDTGKVVWHFQTVHHDLWDYDVASQPALITSAGRDAVAVGSKTGHLFLLDRATGKPLFGVEERPVPKSDVEGEQSSPTQPFPILPAPLAPAKFELTDAASPEDRKWCEDHLRGLRYDGVFTPPSLQGSLVYPGNIGGMAWGGIAFDPNRELIVVPTNRLAAAVRLIPRADFAAARKANSEAELAEQAGTPYGMSRQFLITPRFIPCNKGSMGAMTAIDAKTGKVRWEIPLPTIHLGGPIVTGGGLIFMGATLDPFLRAFDIETGAELWKGALPTSARSVPMTYQTKSGKQFVVISAGGHEVPGWKQGDAIVAFSLP